MRPFPTLIAAGILVVATVALRATGAHAHPGLPSWALMTFAVAAFSGPVR
jgi:hypothetical protein